MGTPTMTPAELDNLDAGIGPADVGVDLDPSPWFPMDPLGVHELRPYGLRVLPW